MSTEKHPRGAESERLFAFEELQRAAQKKHAAQRKRTEEEAAEAQAVLLDRLKVPAAAWCEVDDQVQRLLLKYCIEVPLNIAWYERAIAGAERRFHRRRMVIHVLVLGALVVVGTLLVDGQKQIIAAQIGILVTALFYGLQILASSTDLLSQIGAFRKASSDLKEALYTFEHTWKRKVVDPGGALSPEFEVALWQEIRNARKIAREERDAYFRTFKSPTEIVSMASTGLDALRARGGERSALHREELAPHRAAAARIEEVRQRLVDARAQAIAVRSKLAALTREGASPAEIAEASKTAMNVDAEVVRYEEMLKMLAKADIMNPS